MTIAAVPVMAQDFDSQDVKAIELSQTKIKGTQSKREPIGIVVGGLESGTVHGVLAEYALS